MLRKLLKYEFKATARILLPLYAALIGFSIINKLLIGFGNNFENLSGLGGIPAIVSILGYVATMVAIGVVSLFIVIQRFYKNLLGDEGYLMNTLPVSINKNLLSKLIVAVAWGIISGVVSILSIIIMAYRPGVFNEIFARFGGFSGFLSEGFNEIGLNMISLPFEAMIFALLLAAHGILLIYTSISLGHLASKRKILSSFGAFIVINIITNIIQANLPSIGSLGGTFMFDGINFNANVTSLAPFHGMLMYGIVIQLIFSAIFFVICNYILKNKLNLE